VVFVAVPYILGYLNRDLLASLNTVAAAVQKEHAVALTVSLRDGANLLVRVYNDPAATSSDTATRRTVARSMALAAYWSYVAPRSPNSVSIIYVRYFRSGPVTTEQDLATYRWWNSDLDSTLQRAR
jgi:hypothetical protein